LSAGAISTTPILSKSASASGISRQISLKVAAHLRLQVAVARLGRYLLNCIAVVLCLAAPAGLGLALAQHAALAWPSLASYAMPSLILGTGLTSPVIRRGLLWALPLGFFLIAYGMLRSFFTCLRHGGVYWRGTLYPLQELRAAQRAKMSDFLRRDARADGSS
jgi:hypothetical protein